jgi:hypothetical protein
MNYLSALPVYVDVPKPSKLQDRVLILRRYLLLRIYMSVVGHFDVDPLKTLYSTLNTRRN